MSRLFAIQINQPLLCAHLSAEDGQTVNDVQVRHLLIEAGFMPRGERWVVRERDLGFLQPSEVITIDSICEST